MFRVYVTPTQTLKHGSELLGSGTLRLHKSTCTFVSGILFRANEKGISILEKMLCLIVGREGRRERRWWASSYQVSPNTVSCVLAHLHISIPTHPHTYSSPPTSSYPHAHSHTYTSSHPHIPISDSFYQPLSAQCHSLPRPHKVKVARKEVNDTVQLSRIPDYDGSYRQVEVAVSEEISRIVRTHICINN